VRDPILVEQMINFTHFILKRASITRANDKRYVFQLNDFNTCNSM